MEIFQYLIIIFALFAMSRVVLRFKDNKFTIAEFIFWDLIWLAVVIVGFFPQITSIVADFVGIGRGIDVFVYAGIILLFYLVYRIYVKLETIEQEITKVVREVALKTKQSKR